METSSETPIWEQSKENAMPLRRGRDVKRFVESEFGKKERLEEELQRHETELLEAMSATSTLADPLKVWVKYIRWMLDNFETGHPELLSLYERCAREFTEDERYKNSETYLKIWIGYADMLDNPTKVFKFLRTNGIGEKLALLYIATAWTAEHRGDFPLADKAYSVGIEKKAQPLELLQKRQREFQRRMSRRWLNQAEQEKQESDETENTSSTRGLRTIQETDAGRLHRPAAIVQDPQRSKGVGGGLGSKARKSGKDFNVFMDKNLSSNRHDWGNTENTAPGQPGWRSFAPEREQAKENVRKAAPWGDQRFGSAPSTRGPVPAAPAALENRLPFGIFVDDDEDDLNLSTAQVNQHKEIFLKERTASEKKSEMEMLRSEPLRNFGKDLPTVKPAPPKVILADEPKESPVRKEIHQQDNDDVTINTRMALNDMLEMFSSPVAETSQRSREHRPRSVSPPRALEVFTDVDDENVFTKENIDTDGTVAIMKSPVVEESRVFNEINLDFPDSESLFSEDHHERNELVDEEFHGIDDDDEEEYAVGMPRGFREQPPILDEGFTVYEDVPLESIREDSIEQEHSIDQPFSIFQDRTQREPLSGASKRPIGGFTIFRD